MKKIVFITALCVLAFFKANTQTYQYIPFPTENAIWSEFYISEEHSMPPYFDTAFDKVALINEDTLIDGKIYKKLFQFNDSIFNISNAVYLGGIREENKMVYYNGNHLHFRKPEGALNEEILLYDFNITIGDTLDQSDYPITTNFATWGYNWVVDDIDTIFFNNTLRRRITFTCSGELVQWIEGIGNLEGLLFASVLPITGTPPRGDLICFKQNDTIVYFNNQFPECMPLNVTKKTVMNENIIIYPNPATDYLTITSGNLQPLPFTFQLYDMQGRLQLTGQTSNTQVEINVATLPRGLYVLKIITSKQSIAKKVVLQ